MFYFAAVFDFHNVTCRNKKNPYTCFISRFILHYQVFCFLGNKKHKQLRDSLEFAVEVILHLQLPLVVENFSASNVLLQSDFTFPSL